eukprot:148742_1
MNNGIMVSYSTRIYNNQFTPSIGKNYTMGRFSTLMIQTMLGVGRLEDADFCVKSVCVNTFVGDFITLNYVQNDDSEDESSDDSDHTKARLRTASIVSVHEMNRSDQQNNSTIKSILLMFFWLMLQIVRITMLQKMFIKLFLYSRRFQGYQSSFIPGDFASKSIDQLVKPIRKLSKNLDVEESFRRFSWGRLSFLQYFRDMLPSKRAQDIKMLRLNLKCVPAVETALQALYGSVSGGGLIIIDHYNASGCKSAVDRFREQNNISNEELVYVNEHCVYWIKTT